MEQDLHGTNLGENEAEVLLVRRAVQGDTEAFAALYDRFMGRVYRYVRYLVRDQNDAEDIAQEVFIRAWRALHRYRETGAPFAAWLIAIAHNLAVNHLKAKKGNVSLGDIDIPTNAAEANPEAMTEASFNREGVRSAVLKLSREKQRVILMRWIEGFSYSEIAQFLNKSEGAVRVIQYRALADLRVILAGGEKWR